jgi:pimeloyl-ACP methyl ester carboxylesterase
MTTALVVAAPGMTLEAFARAAGLHPDLVKRLVVLGVLDGTRTAAGELRLPPTQLAAAARIQRLRAGFGLNYAAIALVMDLLDQIEQLRGERQWTRIA